MQHLGVYVFYLAATIASIGISITTLYQSTFSIPYTFLPHNNKIIIPTSFFLNLYLPIPLAQIQAAQLAHPFPTLLSAFQLDCDILALQNIPCLQPFNYAGPAQQLATIRTFGDNYIRSLASIQPTPPVDDCIAVNCNQNALTFVHAIFCAILFNTTFSVPIQLASGVYLCTANANGTLLYNYPVTCAQLATIPNIACAPPPPPTTTTTTTTSSIATTTTTTTTTTQLLQCIAIGNTCQSGNLFNQNVVIDIQQLPFSNITILGYSNSYLAPEPLLLIIPTPSTPTSCITTSTYSYTIIQPCYSTYILWSFPACTVWSSIQYTHLNSPSNIVTTQNNAIINITSSQITLPTTSIPQTWGVDNVCIEHTSLSPAYFFTTSTLLPNRLQFQLNIFNNYATYAPTLQTLNIPCYNYNPEWTYIGNFLYVNLPTAVANTPYPQYFGPYTWAYPGLSACLQYIATTPNTLKDDDIDLPFFVTSQQFQYRSIITSSLFYKIVPDCSTGLFSLQFLFTLPATAFPGPVSFPTPVYSIPASAVSTKLISYQPAFYLPLYFPLSTTQDSTSGGAILCASPDISVQITLTPINTNFF